MPAIDVSRLDVFDPSIHLWPDFRSGKLEANLRCLRLFNAVFFREEPIPPEPIPNNANQDARRRFEDQMREFRKLSYDYEDNQEQAYSIIKHMCSCGVTRPVIDEAEKLARTENPHATSRRAFTIAILHAMDVKFNNGQNSNNLLLLTSWDEFSWAHRYGCSRESADEPLGYKSVETFSSDWYRARFELDRVKPNLTQDESFMLRELLKRLRDGFTDYNTAATLSGMPGASCISVLTTLVNIEAQRKLTGTASGKVNTAQTAKRTLIEANPTVSSNPARTGHGMHRRGSNAECYNCKKTGHLYKNCPDYWCVKCKQKLTVPFFQHLQRGDCNHFPKDFPAKRSPEKKTTHEWRLVKRVKTAGDDDDPPEDYEEDTLEEFSTGNLFNESDLYDNSLKKVVKVVKVNALKTDQSMFLLDSGAEVGVVTPGSAHAMEKDLIPGPHVNVSGVNGKSGSNKWISINDFEFLALEGAQDNIIPEQDIVDKGYMIIRSKDGVQIARHDDQILRQVHTIVDITNSTKLKYITKEQLQVLSAKVVATPEQIRRVLEYHIRSGHQHASAMANAIQFCCWINTNLTPSIIHAVMKKDPCIDCAVGKMKRHKIGLSSGVSPRPGQTLSFDWLPVDIYSIDGHTGLFLVVDAGTGNLWACPAKGKSTKDLLPIIKRVLLDVLKHGHFTQNVYTDLGSTETSDEIRTLMMKMGINPKECNVRRQESNPVEKYVEVINKGVATYFESLPWLHKGFWNYAATAFAVIRSTMPGAKSGESSPFMMLTGNSVDYNKMFMYPFGTIVAVVHDKENPTHPKSRFEGGFKGFIVGYDLEKINENGYVIYVPNIKATITAGYSDITVLKGSTTDLLQRLGDVSASYKYKDVYPEVNTNAHFLELRQSRIIEDVLKKRRELIVARDIPDLAHQHRDLIIHSAMLKDYSEPISVALTEVLVNVLQGADYEVKKAKVVSEDSPSIQRIMKDEVLFEMWRESITKEMTGLSNDSLEYLDYIDIPFDAVLLDSMMRMTTKRNNVTNKITKLKARFLIRGDQETDIEKMFSPSSSRQSFLLLIQICVQFALILAAFDVEQAFLNASLTTVIYVRLPRALFDYGNKLNLPSRYCKLKRSVYGLKEAPKLWNQHINETLTSMGFKRCVSDICVYVMGEVKKNNFIIIVLTVDDGAVGASTNDLVSWLFNELRKTYKITTQESLVSYSGCNIKQTRDAIYVNQPAYIQSLPDSIRDDYWQIYESMRYATTPISSVKNESDIIQQDEYTDDIFLEETIPDSCKEVSEKDYLRLCGSIIYAAPLHPGIMYATSILAARAKTHKISDYIKLIRIVKYLNKNSDKGLKFTKVDRFQLLGMSDAAWISDILTSKSHYCNIITLGGCYISMVSKNIKMIMLSSTDAEQYGITELAKTILYWRDYLTELGLQECVQGPTPILQDNKSAITICETVGKNAKKVKYFLMRINFVTELISEDIIQLFHVSTEKLLPDIGTKSLGPAIYNSHDEILTGHTSVEYKFN